MPEADDVAFHQRSASWRRDKDKFILKPNTPPRTSASVTVNMRVDATAKETPPDAPHLVLKEAPHLVSKEGPDAIVPNDFWAVRDLLLVGHDAIFMKPDSDGAGEVKQAAVELAKLLPKLHPHENCRERMADLLEGQTDDTAIVTSLAKEAWACLPGNFSTAMFDAAYDPSNVLGAAGVNTKEYLAGMASKMPHLLDESLLGACQGSQWPRTCSYWVSFHGMAYLADVHGLSRQFLRALAPVIAGGATMCHGCTLHFRLFHEPMLSENLVKDLGTMF